MGAYTKNVAVIKGLKDGFSADGGELSGLIRCEKYGSSLRVEATYINFAPLDEGRLVVGVSDGAHTQIFEGNVFEGESEVDTSRGFAALICYVNGGVYSVASAVCGGFAAAALGIKQAVEKAENIAPDHAKKQAVAYEDEAIAEENYYEYAQTDAGGGSVREDKKEEKDGEKLREDETHSRPVAPPLARGECFYARMKGEIENVLTTYPREDALEEVVENSRWVKINYGDGKYYVFGVISEGDSPQYICYGVPAESDVPPDSLKGMASLIPTAEGGFWVMYQDAFTGASLKIETE